MVVADLSSLQALAQALLDSVILLASRSTIQPSQLPPSRSVRRRRRMQATLRKLYSASGVDGSPVAHQDTLPQVSSVQGCAVSSADVTPSPIPTGSVLQTKHIEALSDDEVATILCDLPSVQLCTYDCSRHALARRLRARLESDLYRLQEQLQGGVRQLHQFASGIRLCDSAMESSGLTPVSAKPDNTAHDPETVAASDVNIC